MADKKGLEREMAKIGPLVFIITLIIIVEFFWWFMYT